MVGMDEEVVTDVSLFHRKESGGVVLLGTVALGWLRQETSAYIQLSFRLKFLGGIGEESITANVLHGPFENSIGENQMEMVVLVPEQNKQFFLMIQYSPLHHDRFNCSEEQVRTILLQSASEHEGALKSSFQADRAMSDKFCETVKEKINRFFVLQNQFGSGYQSLFHVGLLGQLKPPHSDVARLLVANPTGLPISQKTNLSEVMKQVLSDFELLGLVRIEEVEDGSLAIPM